MRKRKHISLCDIYELEMSIWNKWKKSGKIDHESFWLKFEKTSKIILARNLLHCLKIYIKFF